MKTLETDQLHVAAIDEKEACLIHGGKSSPKWVTFLLFLGSPALGIFHMGVKEGYREEARG